MADDREAGLLMSQLLEMGVGDAAVAQAMFAGAQTVDQALDILSGDSSDRYASLSQSCKLFC